jgi:hypothetical protein
MQINRERVKLLVDALRSGEYEQGRSYLRQDDSFCCLGVACEVARKNGLEGNWELSNYGAGIQTFGNREYSSIAVLPAAVIYWYGFDGEDPRLRLTSTGHCGHSRCRRPSSRSRAGRRWRSRRTARPRTMTAAQANDYYKLSFEEIADGFEHTYLEDDDAN